MNQKNEKRNHILSEYREDVVPHAGRVEFSSIRQLLLLRYSGSRAPWGVQVFVHVVTIVDRNPVVGSLGFADR